MITLLANVVATDAAQCIPGERPLISSAGLVESTDSLQSPGHQNRSVAKMTGNDFRTIEPKVLYFGSPVALVSSLNDDGNTNLAPISSFWALGWTFLLGIITATKTADNLKRHPECVVNIPHPDMWEKGKGGEARPAYGKEPCACHQSQAVSLRER